MRLPRLLKKTCHRLIQVQHLLQFILSFVLLDIHHVQESKEDESNKMPQFRNGPQSLFALLWLCTDLFVVILGWRLVERESGDCRNFQCSNF